VLGIDPLFTAQVFKEIAATHGIRRRDDIFSQEIVGRLLYPMINEAAEILEECITLRPGDIDTVWVAGYGVPAHRGCPLWMVDTIGLPRVVQALRK
jgi:3-hydroxyacyl-CoA dehydrogenase